MDDFTHSDDNKLVVQLILASILIVFLISIIIVAKRKRV